MNADLAWDRNCILQRCEHAQQELDPIRVQPLSRYTAYMHVP